MTLRLFWKVFIICLISLTENSLQNDISKWYFTDSIFTNKKIKTKK